MKRPSVGLDRHFRLGVRGVDPGIGGVRRGLGRIDLDRDAIVTKIHGDLGFGYLCFGIETGEGTQRRIGERPSCWLRTASGSDQLARGMRLARSVWLARRLSQREHPARLHGLFLEHRFGM